VQHGVLREFVEPTSTRGNFFSNGGSLETKPEKDEVDSRMQNQTSGTEMTGLFGLMNAPEYLGQYMPPQHRRLNKNAILTVVANEIVSPYFLQVLDGP
jgi:hypothetical protein